MNIRPAISHDVPLVLPMVTAIARFHENLDAAKYGVDGDPADSYRGWLTARATDPRAVFLVGDAGPANGPSNLVAFLVGGVQSEIPIYRVKQYGFIYDLWVEEKYRNEGIARKLVTLAIERFGTIGVTQIRLDTAYANTPAQKLFETCGFRPSIVEMLISLE